MKWFVVGMLTAVLPLVALPCAGRPTAAKPPLNPTIDTKVATVGPSLRTITHRGRTFHVATIDLKVTELHLVGQGPEWTGPRTLSALADTISADGQRLVWATNIGIFHDGGQPVGLHVEDGQVLSPLNTNDGAGNFFLKPNGAFLVGSDGARIRTTDELSDGLGNAQMGSQSGPILLRQGQLHPALKAESPNLRLRSGVGVSKTDVVHFAISDGPVRFHELATLFRDELGCADALYLDGVISEWVTPERGASETKMEFSGFFFVNEDR